MDRPGWIPAARTGARRHRQVHALPRRADVRSGSASHPAVSAVRGAAVQTVRRPPAPGGAGADRDIRLDLRRRVRHCAAGRIGAGRHRRGRRDGALSGDPVFRRAGHDRGPDDAAVHGFDVAGGVRAWRPWTGPLRLAWRAARAHDAQPAGVRAVSVRAHRGLARRVSAAARPRASACRAVERDARGLRADDGAVVRVQLRDARPLHALPGRRRRPRAVGRLMAGDLVRPHAERAHASGRRHRRSRRARSTRGRGGRARAAAGGADARVRPSVGGHSSRSGPRRPTRWSARSRASRPTTNTGASASTTSGATRPRT